jgi:hypothetical protein
MTDPPQLCTVHCCRLRTCAPRCPCSPGTVRCASCAVHRARRGRHGGTRDPIRCPAVRSRPSSQRFPTPTGVRENSDLSPSSPSSPVWKLGIGPLRAGQRPSRHVGPLWGNDLLLLSTRGHLDGCAHRPPAVHLLSPAPPRPIPSPCPGRRPAAVRAPWTRPPRRWTATPWRGERAGRRRRVTLRAHLGSGLGTEPRATADTGTAVPPRSRSPQGVHIPGDNSATCRQRRGARPARMPARTRSAGASPAAPGCGQPARRPGPGSGRRDLPGAVVGADPGPDRFAGTAGRQGQWAG